MPDEIETAFIEEYRSEVIEEHQNKGSRFAAMTRRGTIQGKSAYWQKFGTFKAGSKGRNGKVTVTNPKHDRVKSDIEDYYVGSMVDDLDLLKTNIDEMGAHARGHAYALGRKEDEIILEAMMNASDATVLGGAGQSFAVGLLNTVSTEFTLNEVPDDGRRFCAVTAEIWSKMLGFDEFANADFVGADDLPYKGGGMTSKLWNGIFWFIENKVWRSTDGSAFVPYPDRTAEDFAAQKAAWRAAPIHHCLAWHQDDVGYDGQLAPKTTVAWENLEQAHSIVSAMAAAALPIQEEGVIKMVVDTSA